MEENNNILGKTYKLKIEEQFEYSLKENIKIDANGYGYYSCETPKQKIGHCRYFLHLDIKNHKKEINKSVLTAFLMNPSNTLPAQDNKPSQIDGTIKNILRMAYKLNYSSVDILNASPIIDGNSESMLDTNESDKIHNKNKEFIENYIKKHTKQDYLIAWGGDDKKIKNKEEYVNIFKNIPEIKLYAYRLTTNKKPCHASIRVENCFKFVSKFLNNEAKLIEITWQNL